MARLILDTTVFIDAERRGRRLDRLIADEDVVGEARHLAIVVRHIVGRQTRAAEFAARGDKLGGSAPEVPLLRDRSPDQTGC